MIKGTTAMGGSNLWSLGCKSRSTTPLDHNYRDKNVFMTWLLWGGEETKYRFSMPNSEAFWITKLCETHQKGHCWPGWLSVGPAWSSWSIWEQPKGTPEQRRHQGERQTLHTIWLLSNMLRMSSDWKHTHAKVASLNKTWVLSLGWPIHHTNSNSGHSPLEE